MKITEKRSIRGIVISFILFIISFLFVYIIVKTKLLTALIIILVSVFLLALTITVFYFLVIKQKRVYTAIGLSLTLLAIILQSVLGYYIGISAYVLGKITDPNLEYTQIGVYVKTDDSAVELADVKEYTFGILDVIDREATNRAIKILSKNFDKNIDVKEYTGHFELTEALISNNDIQVILINEIFLEMFSETEGYEEYPQQLRKLYSIKVKTKSDSSLTITSKPEADYFTLYITAIDGVGGISRKSRSDVNILATVNTKTGQILLVSTPRDFFVPLSISNGVPDKLTHAGIYGTNVSRDTIAMLYDIDIDYYFKVNFDGFKNIIDALGGITVNSEYTFKSNRTTFVKGENFLNGEQALVFARTRYAFASGDRQRGKNQMEVLRSVIDKVISPTLLTNYTSILKSVEGCFETDIPYEKISSLVKNQLKNGTSWNTTTYSVNGTGASRQTYSMGYYSYVMIPDHTTIDHAKALIKQVQNGEIPKP